MLALVTLTGAALPPGDTPQPREPGAEEMLGEPQTAAHAHNDYEHDRPLFDALEHGFTSVEADVWLVGGELLVAHDLAAVRPGVTLESLYLDPLADVVHGPGRGSVYPRWNGTFQLLIDIKSESETTYAAIEAALAKHPEIMSGYAHGRTMPGAVTAVVSGNRPLVTMQSQDRRFSFYDGRSGDLGGGLPPTLMPLVSDNWTSLFAWNGDGAMPEAERAKLHEYVTTAHEQGYRVRFWATPDTPGAARDAVWAELHDAGVDHINTDDLAALEEFLSGRG